MLETVELGELRNDEVLVRVEASGVCHTDVVVQNMIELPAVLGHEGAGVIEAIGKGVTRFKPGDRVIVSYASCGHCPNCVEGECYFCDDFLQLNFGGARMDQSHTITWNGKPITSNFFQQSSFATHLITQQRSLVKVDSGTSSEMLASLPCGVITGAGAIVNTLKASAKDSLAVFGTGAVGLSAIMMARVLGVTPIIAVEISQERLNLALELGATHVINVKDGDVPERIKDIVPRGVKFSFETSSNEQALNDAILSLRIGGECGMATAPHIGEKYPFCTSEILVRGANLRGICLGSALPGTFIPRLIELQQQGLFPYERLIKSYDFADINRAFADSKAGIAIKPVLRMS